jgi:formate hydrogenlyase transcriptional activator
MATAGVVFSQRQVFAEAGPRGAMSTPTEFEGIIGNSPALQSVLAQVERVALTDSTVLVLGETGTGKELMARAIHDRSRRKERRFVTMNCAAIPAGLLESELFGYEKGAFTGAITQRGGRLESADQGTLFLDEVGDIPIEIQPKLLRALQEREFERLGSTYARKVNVRLVAATNRNLEKMIANKEFRSDLYYRLNVFPIRIPPLRERKDDIPLLVNYFVRKLSAQMQKRIEEIPEELMGALFACDWPGNIRQLENFIERAMILTRGKSLEAPVSELRESVVKPTASTEAGFALDDHVVRIVKRTIGNLEKTRCKALKNYEAESRREEIMHVLRESNGQVGGANGAAARMGVKRTTLISRMKTLGISFRSEVTA